MFWFAKESDPLVEELEEELWEVVEAAEAADVECGSSVPIDAMSIGFRSDLRCAEMKVLLTSPVGGHRVYLALRSYHRFDFPAAVSRHCYRR